MDTPNTPLPVSEQGGRNTTLPVLYYDGACPVCSREIAMYRQQPGAEGVEWVDVTRCGPQDLGAAL